RRVAPATLRRVIALRWLPESWRKHAGTVWYVAMALTLFVGSLLPANHSQGTQFGGMPNRPFDALAIVAIVLQCLPLLACRRWPVVCLCVVTVGFAIDQLRGYHTFAGTAFAVAVLTLGSRLERRRGTAALV